MTTHVTIGEFKAFLRDALPGQRIIYARGKEFALDCTRNGILKDIRHMAWDGPFYLLQRRIAPLGGRHNPATYEYIAVKTERKYRHLRPDPSMFTVGADGMALEEK